MQHKCFSILSLALVLALTIPTTATTPTVAQGPLAAYDSPGERRSLEHPGPLGDREFATDHVIVKIAPYVDVLTPGRQSAWTESVSLNQALSAQGVLSLEPVFLGARAPRPGEMVDSSTGTRLPKPDLSRWYRAGLSDGADVGVVIEALRADPGIEYVEPDYLAYPADTIPDDPLLPQQWGLDKIEAPAAWDIITGTQTVVIAVVDSGIDTTHSDLASRLWVNPGEIPANGLDDDNNGYVDDVQGWSFVSGSNDIYDGNGHGTQVAGVAAAAGNNGVGIAGVCWNCRIMPVKVMADSGISNYSDIALGVRYAADKGAHVINLSLGGYAYSNALREAITYATGKGAVVVGGAGNDNVSTSFYPAAYEEVIAVAATDASDAKMNFSNYGTWVDLSAPGAVITTTFLGGDWGPADGTSLSTPFVAGLAGLVRSHWPSWTPALVRNQLEQTADAIDALNPAYAGELGAGRINAAAAMQDPHPVLTLDGTAVNGDPLGHPTPGETATLAATLSNAWADAVGVSGVLSTTDPYVTLANDAASYGDIPAGGTGTGSPVYSFTVAGAAGYNYPISFTLSVSANGGAYTTTIPFTITTRSGDEHFCGTVAEDQTWTNDKTYILDCNVGVAPGYTLTIQAGTEVHFAGDYNLNVGGTLIADGTAGQPVRLMPHTGGSWGRIFFDDPSVDAQATVSGTYQSGNLLRHVRIEGAAQGIGCTSATPYLDHVTLTGGGMTCAAGDTALWVQDSDLSGDVQISAGSGVDGVLGTWTARTPMPTARSGLGVAAAPNGKLYAIGGNGSGGHLATVEEYDPETDSWTARAPMPTARYELGVVAAPNGKIYAIGGVGGEATVEEYDPATNTWTSRTSMPTARHFLGVAATSDGKIYAIGGYDSDTLATVEEYNTVTDTWAPRASMLTARWGPGVAAASNSRIYAIGGDNVVSLDTVEEYDPATDTWVARTNMPTARSMLGVAMTSDGKIYAIGGQGGIYLATAEEYDPATDTWMSCTSMPTERYGLGVAAAPNGKLYAIGGYNGSPLATVEEFTPPTDEYGYHIMRSILRGNTSLPDYSEVQDSSVDGNITVGGLSAEGSLNIVQNTTIAGNITFDGTAAGTIADSTVYGTISLSGGMAENNTVRSGGISVGSGSVLSNTISGGGISINGSGEARANSVENAPGWGIQASGNAAVEYNRVVGCGNGIQASGGVVEYNLIAGTAGVGLELSGTATAEYNTFTGNGGSAVQITAGTAMTITGNNFEFNSGTYDVEDLVPKATMMTVNARGNWWGTTSGAAIRQRIFDFSDDYTLGTVLYSPVLTQPSTIAPAYVRAITLTPESPVGIQTVAFDVLFSREMDTDDNPLVEFYTTKNGSWYNYNTGNSGLASNDIKAIAVNAAGDKWFGTWNSGASVLYADNTWQTYNTGNSGLTRDDIEAMAVDAAGSTWFGFGTNGGGVSVLDGSDTWQGYSTSNSELANDYVRAIAVDATGNMWFGTLDGVSVLHVDDTWQSYNTSNSGLASNYISVIIVDTAGNKWFGTSSGVSVLYADSTWQTYNTSNSGLVANIVTALAVDAAGNKWFGTGSGVSVLRADGTWQTYTTSNSGLANNAIYDIAADTKGNTWFGTDMGGASVLRPEGTWQTYTAANSGLPYDRVTAIAVDAAGNKWFGGHDAGNGVSILWDEAEYTVADSAQWLSSTLYRATYDINALIPRDTYTITVSGAKSAATTVSGTLHLPIPGGGMEIAPYSGVTFTVDYAGYINDTTAPPAPAVTACAASTPDTLSAVWSAYDPESAIDKYQYAIGATPQGAEVVNWTFTALTATTRISLSLVAGQTYYFSVKARNEGGIWSEAGSVGVVAGSGECASTEPVSPEVDFSATPRTGDAPLEVQFTSVVTGAVTSYAWDFGDSGTSTLSHPTHTYTSAGSFGVTLAITGPGGTAQAVKPGYITVNTPSGAPTATFSADIVSGTAPLTVTFTTVTSGTVEHWLWSFGDGDTASTGPVVSHTYVTSGTFGVSLTISNTVGSYTVSKPNYIHVIASEIPPNAIYLPLVLRNK